MVMKRDKTFVKDLTNSHVHVKRVAAMLRTAGVGNVRVPELRVRPSIEQRAEFSDHGDILVGDKVVEVKERRIQFTGPGDFPYPDLIVDVAHKKPADVYIFTDTRMNAMLLRGDTRAEWTEKRLYDRPKGRYRNFYLAPTRLCQPWVEGVRDCFAV